jgi:hypothetical protein
LLISAAGSTWANRRGQRKSRGVMMIPAAPMLSSPGLPAPKRGRQTRNDLPLPLLPSPPAQAITPDPAVSPSLSLAGQILPCLAVDEDPARRLLLAASIDGTLRWYAADSLRLLGACRLHQPAYQLVLDGARGRLYTASAPLNKFFVGSLGDCERATGDIHAYDLRPFLDSAGDTSHPVQPLHTHSVSAHITHLSLSADGSWLVYLAETSRQLHAGRIVTESWVRDQMLELPFGGTSAMTQAPGDGPLYTLASGRVDVLDPQTWKILSRLRVGGTVATIASAGQDRLCLLERRLGLFIQVVDVPSRKILGHWSANAEGRVYMRCSMDGRRLYLGSSAVYRGSVQILDVAGADLDRPALLGQARSDRQHLLRGPLLLSRDGRYLITGSGLVFRTGS